MQAMQIWRRKRSARNPKNTAFRRPSRGLKKPLPRLVATAAHWLAERHVGGHLGKGLRGIIDAYAPSAVPKALSFDLRSVRRLWGSTLAIGIRLKW